jgi:hypothetical protein
MSTVLPTNIMNKIFHECFEIGAGNVGNGYVVDLECVDRDGQYQAVDRDSGGRSLGAIV